MKSDCCSAEIICKMDDVNEGTGYFECSKCGKPCNIKEGRKG